MRRRWGNIKIVEKEEILKLWRREIKILRRETQCKKKIACFR